MRALVVDDDEAVRALVRSVLAGGGFEVAEAVDGAEGLRLAEHEVPDLVVLDWQMPGLTGVEVLTELGRHYPEVPVILLTAALDPRYGGFAGILGAAEFIQKPFRPDVLLATARRLLRG